MTAATASAASHRAAPCGEPRRVQPSGTGLRDGVVIWMLLALSTIAFCGCTGIQHFGVFGTLAKAAPSPVVRALATAAHVDLAASGQGYVERVEWTRVGDTASLRVYPTAAGRQASTRLVGPDQAWGEVLRLAPDADKPGMRDQFVCHWRLAEFAQPGKVSWNLEPWRPSVGAVAMITSRCNPGGTEESA